MSTKLALGGNPENLRDAVEHYINYFSHENGSNTPDFILADYLMGCLANFDKTLQAREKWFGREIGLKGVEVPLNPPCGDAQ